MDFEVVESTVLRHTMRQTLDRVMMGESFLIERYGENLAVMIPYAEYLEIEKELVEWAKYRRETLGVQ